MTILFVTVILLITTSISQTFIAVPYLQDLLQFDCVMVENYSRTLTDQVRNTATEFAALKNHQYFTYLTKLSLMKEISLSLETSF